MSENRFGGGSADLLQRLRPTRVDVVDLLDVARVALPELATDRLRLDLVQRSGAGSLVVLQEDERRLRVHLDELADEMTRAGVPPTPDGILAALRSWVDHRPVTDAAAAAAGVAVLDWRDRARTSVGWRVVVRRADTARPWTPSADVDATAVQRTRSAATQRSQDILLDLRVEGPVTLWSHPVVPVLATAVLATPDRMLEQVAVAGTDVHVVVTPHRPVACAERSIAARLAGETSEASVTVPWPRLTGFAWL